VVTQLVILAPRIRDAAQLIAAPRLPQLNQTINLPHKAS
jgi:hypothetical protein